MGDLGDMGGTLKGGWDISNRNLPVADERSHLKELAKMTMDSNNRSLSKNVCFLDLIQHGRTGKEAYEFSRPSSVPLNGRGDDSLRGVRTESSMVQYIDVDQNSLPHPSSGVYQLMLSKLEQDLYQRLRAAEEVLEQDEAVFAQEFQGSSLLLMMSGSDSETRATFGHYMNDKPGASIASCLAGAQAGGCGEYFAALPALDHPEKKWERECDGVFTSEKVGETFDTTRVKFPRQTERAAGDSAVKRKRGRPRKPEVCMPVTAGSKGTGDLKSDKPKAQSDGCLQSIVVKKEGLVSAAEHALVDDGIGGGRVVPLSSIVVPLPQVKDSHLERPKTGKKSVIGKQKKQRGRPPKNLPPLSPMSDLGKQKRARQDDGNSPRSDVTHVSPRRL